MASVNELMNLTHVDVAKMSRTELAKVVNQLSSVANKRLTRLEQNEFAREAPAYKKAMESGGKFTTKGKSQGQLQGEFARVHNFLNKKTSTLSGVKSVRKERDAITGKTFDTVDEEKEFWRNYRMLEEEHRSLIHRHGSDIAIKMLRKEVEKEWGDAEKARENMSDKFNKGYEAFTEAEEDDNPYDY